MTQKNLGRLDYFAAAALTGIMANPERWKQIARDYKSGKKTYQECSRANAIKAYSIAEEMLSVSNSYRKSLGL